MKRAYKLQEFVAHSSNVNCLKIGKKSSRVLVTGGEDHKVNMWAIGKPNAILSLSGHTSAVESVTFDAAEVLVVAGAASGTIKLWDLEEAKIVRTLTGHRSNCISVDFHPFGEFFASGSLDTNLKIWDIRRKGCIHTYKGHTRGVNCLKFSPDGRWVVSGSEDNTVKLWDLTAGKIMHDFKYHDGQVLCLDFHPHEFLLATGSADKTVKFYDLETFELIGSSGPEATGVRAMTFNPDGRTLLTAMQETLKVLSWEPLRCHDMVDASWSKIADLNVHEGKLLGCSYNQSCVGVWVVDLSRVAPHQTANVKRSNSGLSGKLAPTMSQGVMSVNDINLKSSRSSATSQIESAMKDLKLETSIKDVKTSSSTKVVEPASNSLRIGTSLSSRASTPLSSSLSTPRKSNFSRPQTSDSVRISTRAETIPAAVVRPVDFVRPSTQSDALPSAHSNFVRPTSQSDAVPTASFVRSSSQSDVSPSSNSTFVRPSSQLDTSLTPPVVLSKDNEDAVVKVVSNTSALRKQATENVNGLKNRITEELQDAKVRMDISSSVSRSSSITEKVNHGSSDLRGCEKNDATAESGEGLRKMGKMRRSISGTEGDLLSRALTGHQFLAEAGNMHHMRQSGNYEAASTNTETRFRTLSAQLDRRDRAPAIEFINGTKSFNHDTSSFMLMKNQSKLEGSEDAPFDEAHIIDQLALRHNTVANIMQSRLTKLQAVRRFWSKNDFKAAIDTMGKMADNAVVADVLSVVIEKSELFTLEIFALVIPLLNSLLESSTPRYIMVGLSTLCKLVKTFGSVIRETISSSPSIGVDLQAEKRLERCNACFRELQAVKASLIPLLRGIGESAKAAQELSIALEGL